MYANSKKWPSLVVLLLCTDYTCEGSRHSNQDNNALLSMPSGACR